MSRAPSGNNAATPTVRPRPNLAGALTRNIQALAERRRQEEGAATVGDRIAGLITRFAGSMAFVCLHAALVVAWALINVGATPLRAFDPSFVILATVASVEAIFISTFILISQNRAQAAADRRADLDLQISLLAEHEVTHLIKLVTQIAEKLGIDDAENPELEELKRTVAPEAVLERLEDTANPTSDTRYLG